MRKKLLWMFSLTALACGVFTPNFSNTDAPVVAEAAVNHTGGEIYFLRPSGWVSGGTYMFIGHDSYTSVFEMSKVAGTDNLYHYTMGNWGGATYVSFAATSTKWGDGGWGPSNRTKAQHYTNIYNNYGFNSGSYYLVTPASSSNDASIDISYKGASYKDVTVSNKAEVRVSKNSVSSIDTNAGTVTISGVSLSSKNATKAVTATTSNGAASINLAPGTTVTYTASVNDGYTFVGWYDFNDNFKSSETTYEIDRHRDANNLYALYTQDVYYTTSFIVNGSTYEQKVLEGSTVQEALDKTVPAIGADYNVVEWDTELDTVVSSDISVNATKYYKSIDRTPAKLGFSYSYNEHFSTLVVFSGKIAYGDDVYCVAKTEGKEETEEFKMYWHKDDGDKKQYAVNVPLEYNILSFKYGQGDNNSSTIDLERDYTNNAIWYNADDDYGSWQFSEDLSTNATENGVTLDPYNIEVNSISNMRMKFTSGIQLSSNFAGIEEYGMELTIGETTKAETWTNDEIAKVNEDGSANPEGEYIVWSIVLNDIPTEAYNTEIKSRCFVTINGEKQYICEERSVSVVSLAEEYTTLLSGVEKLLCNYIVTTYKVN